LAFTALVSELIGGVLV